MKHIRERSYDMFYSLEHILAELKVLIAEEGSQARFAKKHNIAEAYLSDILRGNRNPGDKVLSAMGYKQQTVYWRSGQ